MKVSRFKIIAYWSFSEGKGNVARDMIDEHLAEVRSASWTKGIKGTGLEFNGKDSYIVVRQRDDLKFRDNDFSTSLWFKTDRIDVQQIFENGHDPEPQLDGPFFRCLLSLWGLRTHSFH